MPIVGIAIVAFLIVAFFKTIGVWGAVLLFVILGVVLYALYQSNKEKVQVEVEARNKRYDEESQLLKQLLEQHGQELVIKKKQLVVAGDYGVLDTTRWEKEKRRFIRTVVHPAMGSDPVFSESLVDGEIEYYLITNSTRLATVSSFSDSMSPIEYEHLCADILKLNGWAAKTTVATGDQGADIVATKGQRKAVVQCKLYSGSVGNASVQEVHAAKGYYQATQAVVVSNATYTRAAREAAAALGVLLLHHDQLADIG